MLISSGDNLRDTPKNNVYQPFEYPPTQQSCYTTLSTYKKGFIIGIDLHGYGNSYVPRSVFDICRFKRTGDVIQSESKGLRIGDTNGISPGLSMNVPEP